MTLSPSLRHILPYVDQYYPSVKLQVDPDIPMVETKLVPYGTPCTLMADSNTISKIYVMALLDWLVYGIRLGYHSPHYNNCSPNTSCHMNWILDNVFGGYSATYETLVRADCDQKTHCVIWSVCLEGYPYEVFWAKDLKATGVARTRFPPQIGGADVTMKVRVIGGKRCTCDQVKRVVLRTPEKPHFANGPG